MNTLEIIRKALNELHSGINALIGQSGDLNELHTEDKTNLVAAINELVANVSGLTPDIQTVLPAEGMLPNLVYNLGEITVNTTMSLAAGTAGKVNHYYFTFSIGNTIPQIAWDSSITEWFVDGKIVEDTGDTPVLAANTYYEVSVFNGVGKIIGV